MRTWRFGIGRHQTLDKGHTLLQVTPAVTVIATAEVRGVSLEWFGLGLLVGWAFLDDGAALARLSGDAAAVVAEEHEPEDLALSLAARLGREQ